MATRAQLEALYEEHAQPLFAFLLNLTRNEADTRDLLQELFAKLVQRPALLDDVRNHRHFLLRLAHNLAIDLIRRRATRERNYERFADEAKGLFASATDPDTGAFRSALSGGLGQLPPEQRAVVHLKLWEGLTFEQIAEMLEIPLNTAASRYRYGIDKLRERLRPFFDEINET